MKLPLILLVLALAALSIEGRRIHVEESEGEELDKSGFDDYEYDVPVHKKSRLDEHISKRIQEKKKEKKADAKEDTEEEDTPLEICDGSKTEACYCELNEVICVNVMFDDDTLLNTLDVALSTNKNMENFKPYVARFADNSITRITRNRMPEGMEESLSALYLERNKITKIDSHAFDGFKNISKLVLTKNRLRTVRSEWFAGDIEKTLHVLDISHNGIKETDKSPFRNLKNLKKLVLDENSLELDEDFFEGLGNLETLSLDDCDLTDDDLPKGLFKPLKKLKVLSLRGNKFTEAPEALEEISHLAYLDLSETNIAEIHRQSFVGEPEMVDIFFEHMPFLTSVQECAFCGLKKLKRLFFDNSSALVHIDENAFGFKEYTDDRADSLVGLRLSRTNISKLPLNMLEYEEMETLDLDRIPLNCTCDQMFLKNVKPLSGQSSNARCAYPKEMKGKYVEQVTAKEICGSLYARGYRFFFALFGVISAAIFVTVGYILFNKGYRFTNIRNIPMPTLPGANSAYTNLNRQEENELTESPTSMNDGTPDFQPRPQMV
ncbi:hypothetical protein PMAYCL1PPCAC_31971 [Pristionchus mayeri]|uniref:LRRCT domain-containing protein n=1 Tax=Pristionchus mayeri TaxID=1317129 RepID=A0AAN5DDZ2_9BILA|nr:hypothetical protein PMAYCL1PPCAC_31971 [Pristionchus mayeri]